MPWDRDDPSYSMPSRPQRPRSSWSSPTLETSGLDWKPAKKTTKMIGCWERVHFIHIYEACAHVQSSHNQEFLAPVFNTWIREGQKQVLAGTWDVQISHSLTSVYTSSWLVGDVESTRVLRTVEHSTRDLERDSESSVIYIGIVIACELTTGNQIC